MGSHTGPRQTSLSVSKGLRVTKTQQGSRQDAHPYTPCLVHIILIRAYIYHDFVIIYYAFLSIHIPSFSSAYVKVVIMTVYPPNPGLLCRPPLFLCVSLSPEREHPRSPDHRKQLRLTRGARTLRVRTCRNGEDILDKCLDRYLFYLEPRMRHLTPQISIGRTNVIAAQPEMLPVAGLADSIVDSAY